MLRQMRRASARSAEVGAGVDGFRFTCGGARGHLMRGVPVLPVHRGSRASAKVPQPPGREPSHGKEVRATGRRVRGTLEGPVARATKVEEGAGKRPSTRSSHAQRTTAGIARNQRRALFRVTGQP